MLSQRLREEHVIVSRCARHGENVRRALDQRRGERLAAQSADVDAFLIADMNRMQARRLAAHGMHAGGRHLNVFAVAEQPAEKALRHRASANISGTNEEDAFHGFGPARYRLGKVKSNRIKSTRCGREAGFVVRWSTYRHP